MKKLFGSLAMVALAVSFAFAQPPHDKEGGKGGPHKIGRHHGRGGMAFKELNLTDAQKAELKTSREDFKKQMQAINADENQTVKQQRERRTALANAQKAKFESILTTEQKGKLAEWKKKGHDKQHEMATKRVDHLKQELGLTDNQVASLKTKQQASQAKFKAIRENDKLDRTAKMEQLKGLRDEMKNNLASVLTKEQQEKFKTLQQERKHKMGDRKDRGMKHDAVK